MFEKQNPNLHSQRELNKNSLKEYEIDGYNILDGRLEELIEELKFQMQREYTEHDKLVELKKNNRERYEELEEIADRTGHSMDFQMWDNLRSAHYLSEELIALFEVKIIYAFKYLEIELKNLISEAYPNEVINKLSKWENLIQLLKSKNIDFKSLKNYKDINELRILNNSIKHSNNAFDSYLENIGEFKNAESVNDENLEKFYDRIKGSINKFVRSLSKEIYSDLYDFDNEKLKNISKSLVLRMNKETAYKLVDLIKENYQT